MCWRSFFDSDLKVLKMKRIYKQPWDRRGDPQNGLRRGIPESERCLQLPWDGHFLFWPAPQSSTLSDCFQSSSSRSPSPWELLQPLAFSFPLLLSFDLRQMALSPVWWWLYWIFVKDWFAKFNYHFAESEKPRQRFKDIISYLNMKQKTYSYFSAPSLNTWGSGLVLLLH